MRKELVVLEREKIKCFERLLHKAKKNDTLNMFLEKCKVDPIYIDWCISGLSFVIPHNRLLKRISDASEGRVSFEELRHIFKGYSQPEIKCDQVWFVEIIEGEEYASKPYYVIEVNVGGEYSDYVKVCPLTDKIKNYSGKTLDLNYGTKDGIKVKIMVLLDDYMVIERKHLVSFICIANGENGIYQIYDNEASNVANYIKNIFK